MPEIAFSENNADKMAKLLHTIGNPLRLSILYSLIDQNYCVCDLSSKLNQRQPCISQHLMILREEGLVDFYQDGWNRFYFISSNNIKNYLCNLQRLWKDENLDAIHPNEKNDE